MMFGKNKNNDDTGLSDAEAIDGLQRNDPRVERQFYLSCQKYFSDRHCGVFEFKSRAKEREDLFQESFALLWQEIQQRRIYIKDNHAWRIDRDGNGRKMSASLKTYLIAIARNKNFENLREEEIYGTETVNSRDNSDVDTEYEEPTCQWIVTLCIAALPPRCKNILTLFYYEEKTLDEILAIRNENQSKDGLKSGKSKCLKNLKEKIITEYKRHNLKICANV